MLTPSLAPMISTGAHSTSFGIHGLTPRTTSIAKRLLFLNSAAISLAEQLEGQFYGSASSSSETMRPFGIARGKPESPLCLRVPSWVATSSAGIQSMILLLAWLAPVEQLLRPHSPVILFRQRASIRLP